ncbi:hypothetical protein OIU74_023868 [Salix koriyanagi]|uniref:Uncharacterized protein n=1 Tax=Salix koriyanagi TaxID=2511006 RepID=A0A9Q0WG85_9ROSI|nr:hypothetical protein OIU74_023868 [Salix koriyanagi]
MLRYYSSKPNDGRSIGTKYCTPYNNKVGKRNKVRLLAAIDDLDFEYENVDGLINEVAGFGVGIDGGYIFGVGKDVGACIGYGVDAGEGVRASVDHVMVKVLVMILM